MLGNRKQEHKNVKVPGTNLRLLSDFLKDVDPKLQQQGQHQTHQLFPTIMKPIGIES